MSKRNIPVLAVVLVALCADCARTDILHFSDGGHHIINYTITDSVRVDYDAPGAATQLDIVDGGRITRTLRAYHNSTINIQGGEIESTVFAWGNCIMSISGGTLDALHILYDAQVTVTSGRISDSLTLIGNNNVPFSGGTIGTDITVDGDALLTFVGGNFAIDGNPVGYGDLASDYALTGTVTGILSNGDTLNNNFSIDAPFADITFIPEPATILLLGFGALSVIRRKI